MRRIGLTFALFMMAPAIAFAGANGPDPETAEATTATWQGHAFVTSTKGSCGNDSTGDYARSSFTSSKSSSEPYSYFSLIYSRGAVGFQNKKKGYWRKNGNYIASGVNTRGLNNFGYTGKYKNFKTVPKNIKNSTETFVMYIDIYNYDGNGNSCVAKLRVTYGKRP